MASQNIIRAVAGLTGINTILAGTIYYNTDQKLERNHEEAEARMDELEGTLRGHIGLIEDALDRIEKEIGTGDGKSQGMSPKAEAMYLARGRDEKK